MLNFTLHVRRALNIKFIGGLCLSLLWSASSFAADIILTDGKIYTVNESQPWAEAVVIKDNEIVYVGQNQQALKFKNTDTRVIGLGDKLVLPGFIDGHMHPGVVGLMGQLGVHLLEESSVEDYIKVIEDYAKTNPDAKVIGGFGFYPEMFGEQGPTKELIDEVVPDRPVFIVSGWGHSGWVNSKALELLGIDKNTPDPFPGAHIFRRDENGEPTGHLIEGAAFWAQLEKLGLGTKEQFIAGYKEFLPALPSIGITTVFDAGTPNVQEYAYRALLDLEKSKELPVRYVGSNYIITSNDAKNAVSKLVQLKEEFTTELVRPMANKISNDGITVLDDNFILFKEKEMTEILVNMARANQDVMIHAIHPDAITETLNAVENVRKLVPNSKSRIVFTHVLWIKEQDYARFAKLNVIANSQPLTLNEIDNHEHYEEMLGLKGKHWDGQIGKNKTLVNSGVVVSGSSDYPACGAPIIELCAPSYGIEVGITRALPGSNSDSFSLPQESEKLSVEEMIKLYTINAAYQLNLEQEIGSIEVGKKADLVVLSRNLFDSPVSEIHDTFSDMTILNGEIIYEASLLDKATRNIKLSFMKFALSSSEK